MGFEERGDAVRALLRLGAADGIDEQSTGRDPRLPILQDALLQRRELLQVFQTPSVTKLRVPTQRSHAGARRVNKHRVHRAHRVGERSGGVMCQELHLVEKPQPVCFCRNLWELVRVKVRSHHPVLLCEVAGLPPGSSAGVQDPLTFRHRPKQTDQLRCLILHLPQPLVVPEEVTDPARALNAYPHC